MDSLHPSTPSPNGGASLRWSSNEQPFAIPSLQQTSDERDCHDQSAHAPNGNGSVDGRLGYASQSPRDCSGRHALTIVARAECPVSLLVRKLEVVDCVSQPVTRETVGAKDRIIEGHRQGRVVDPRRAPGIPWLVLDLVQCLQRPPGLAIEHLNPTLKSLASG